MKISRWILAAVLAFAALPSVGAIAIGSHKTASTTAGTTVTTTGVTTSATGSTFVISVHGKAAIATSTPVTDNMSNTYTLKESNTAGGFGNIYVYQYVCQNCTGGSGHTATANWSASTAGTIYFTEITGAAAASYDAGGNTSSNTQANTVTGASVTTTNANDLILSLWGGFQTDNSITDSGTGFSMLDSQVSSGFPSSGLSYAIKSATGTYNDTYTVGSTGDYTGSVVISLKQFGSVSCSHNGYTSAGASATPNGTSGSYVGKTGGFVTPDCATINYWQPSVGNFGVN